MRQHAWWAIEFVRNDVQKDRLQRSSLQDNEELQSHVVVDRDPRCLALPSDAQECAQECENKVSLFRGRGERPFGDHDGKHGCTLLGSSRAAGRTNQCGTAHSRARSTDKFAMTCAQEMANAVTMFAPTLALVHSIGERPHVLVMVLLVGSAMHLPVSFTYHLGCALNHYPDRIDNDMRRLDQTLQIVSGSLFAGALSGSWLYGILHFMLHLRSICTMWWMNTSNDGNRWKHVLLSVLAYLAPMQWRGDTRNYALALGCMTVGGLCFVPSANHRFFRGWGHSVFHAILFVYARVLADSASKIAL